MIDEALMQRILMEGGENTQKDYSSEPRKFYGVTVGRVINPLDPLMLGRLQVQLPFIDGLDLSPWARVATPMAGIFSGFYFIPKFGDEVLVAFEHGDVNAPYIIGSLWNAFAPPPMASPLPQVRAIRTPLGNQIVFADLPTPTLVIQNGPTPPEALPAPTVPGAYQSIMLSATGTSITTTMLQVLATGSVQIMVAGNVVTVGPDGVNIASASKIELSAVGAINITAGGTVTMTAPMVKIN